MREKTKRNQIYTHLSNSLIIMSVSEIGLNREHE
jgi:hypothetical protein